MLRAPRQISFGSVPVALVVALVRVLVVAEFVRSVAHHPVEVAVVVFVRSVELVPIAMPMVGLVAMVVAVLVPVGVH